MKRIVSLILGFVFIASSLVFTSAQAVMAADPLNIMEPPVSQNVSANANVTFSVSIFGGVQPYGYQWQYATSATETYQNVTTGGSGYTAATLTINSVTTAMNGYYYRCVITDSDNPPTTMTSLSARLQVTSGATQTAAPTASYNSGTTANSNIIGINAAISLATTATVANNPKIYYTTGTTAASTPTPTLASREFDYSECIQAPSVPGTFCVKAIATSSNAATSNVATFNYTVTNDVHRLSDIKSEPAFLVWKANKFQSDMPQVVADKIDAVINRMSLNERARFTVGDGSSYGTGRVPGTAGQTIAMIDFGIPQTSLSDGPAGLRITTGSTTSTYFRRPTYWPNGSARSSTWNKDLIYKMGDAWGAECYYFSSDVQLAPGMNIHRSVLNGRNFEYYSEDPLLSGMTAAMEVSGFQQNNPVGMMIKHFAVNNQETNRTNKNTQVATRTLREIYLRNFEYAVQYGKPWAVMNSYNQVNSVSTAQNYGLNTVILKGEWGFKGFLCTDWGSGTGGYGNAGDFLYRYPGFTGTTALTANNASRLASGNDTLQYASTDNAGITSAVANQSHPLTQERVDQAVRLLLTMVVKSPSFNNKPLIFGATDQELMDKNRALGMEIGEEAVTLLKNEKINGTPALPLATPTDTQQVLLLGTTMNTLINGGTGSGAVNMGTGETITSLANAVSNIVGSSHMINANSVVTSTTNGEQVVPQSYFDTTWNTGNISAVVYAYRRTSAEGSDQSPTGSPTTSMVGYQNSVQETNLMIQASNFANAHNIPFIVILNMGTWTTVSTWEDRADGIIMGWEQGMAGGTPMAEVLFGRVNPSGKTPTSVPYAISGNAPNGARYNPSEGQFGGTGAATAVYYNEGIYVGYRYFDTFNVPVAFPFGHGLSYTKFTYSDATLRKATIDSVSDIQTASVTITNTGDVPGKEVVQFYIGAPGIEMPKPVKELKGFEKTKLLQPGESQTIHVYFDTMALASYADGSSAGTTAGDWLVEPGHYVVYFASSSQDIRATKSFVVSNGFVARHDNADAMEPTAANQATLEANAIKPNQITVTFNPGGGETAYQKVYPVMGGSYGYLPELPAGFGWYIQGTGSMVSPDEIVTAGDKTLVPDKIVAKYDVNVEVLEWGSAVTHLIIDTQSTVNASDIALDSFTVSAVTRNPVNSNTVYSGARTITNAYVSATKEKGKPAASGRYIVLELKYGYNATAAEVNGSAALVYQSRNYWLNMTYTVSLAKPVTGVEELSYATTNRLIYDDFKLIDNPVANYTAQKYRMYTPAEAGQGQALPLVLWNHGAGENYGTTSGASNEGAQLFANLGGVGWVKNAPEACYILTPQRNYSSYSRNGVVAFIKDLVAKGLVDENRIYVAGCSQGGQETHNYLLENPTLFAGAVPICPLSGSGLTVAQLTTIKHVPIWYVHSVDDATVAAVNSQTPYDRLIAMGPKDVRRTLFPGVSGTEVPNPDYAGKNGLYYPDGHWSWVMLLNNKYVENGGIPDSTEGTTFMDWLFAQTNWKHDQGEIVITRSRNTISANVKDCYVNGTDKAVNARLYVALYDEANAGRLLAVKSSNIVSVPAYNGYKEISIEPFDFGDAGSAKAYLWNADTFVPLLMSASKSLAIEDIEVPNLPGHHYIPVEGSKTIYIDERIGGVGGSFTSSGVVAPDTGHQYLSSFNNNASYYTSYRLYFEEAGTYSIAFRYGNSGAATNQVTLTLNGTQAAGGFNWPASGGWTTWVSSAPLGTFVVPEREVGGYDLRIVPGTTSINILAFTITRVS